MTTLYRHAVSERIQSELDRIKSRISDIGTLEGNIIVDNSWFNGVLNARVGASSPELEREFYGGLMDFAVPKGYRGGTITFPAETLAEYSRFVQKNKKELATSKYFQDSAEEISERIKAMDALRALRMFMRLNPTEMLITPEKEAYRPAIRAAMAKIAGKEGVMKESYAVHLTGRDDHANNDVGIMTTAVLVTLSHPVTPTYLLTRDVDLRNMVTEIKGDNGQEFARLAEGHGFPSHPHLVANLNVLRDNPRGPESLGKMGRFYEAHLEHERIRAEQHRRKNRSRATV